jgi:hypothetical protein
VSRNFDSLSHSEKCDAVDALQISWWLKRGIGLVVATLVLLMAGCPPYSVWQQGMSGRAELTRAEQNRQIQVQEARAKLDAAQLLNQAEVARAEGLAEATALVVDSFGGPDSYLRYLWIQSLENNKANIIYVPTEAGLPILEAGRSVTGE